MAAKKKNSKKKATKKKVTKPVDAGPVTLELAELYVYKLKLLNKCFDEAKAAVTAPMKAQFEAELVRRVNEALEQDPAVQLASQERTECVNEVVEEVADRLPLGYTVAAISPEDATITAVFNPKGKKVT